MKQTLYLLKNSSLSEGTYLYNGEYKSLFPNEEITLNTMPTSITDNIKVSMYKKDIGEKILNLKPRKNTSKNPR